MTEGSTTAVTFAEDQLRARISELRDLGLRRERECVLLGAAAMIERSIAAYHRRGDVGVGWLADLVRRGGPAESEFMSPRRRVLAAMDAWKAGYPPEEATT